MLCLAVPLCLPCSVQPYTLPASDSLFARPVHDRQALSGPLLSPDLPAVFQEALLPFRFENKSLRAFDLKHPFHKQRIHMLSAAGSQVLVLPVLLTAAFAHHPLQQAMAHSIFLSLPESAPERSSFSLFSLLPQSRPVHIVQGIPSLVQAALSLYKSTLPLQPHNSMEPSLLSCELL